MMIALDAPDGDAGSSLADAVFARLKSDILLGVLAAGSRLRFVELHQRYGVGTSPLREALSRLAADRLVSQETNRGFRVAEISLDDFMDIARVRKDLECRAIVESIDRRGDRWEEALIIAHHRLQKLGRQETQVSGPAGVSREWEVRHRAFHLALISSCGSPWTLHFCGLLHDQFDRYRRSVRTDAKVQAKLAMHHGALVEAALAGAAERARTVLAEHIDQTAAAVVARLRDKPKRKAGAHTMVPPSTKRS
jgi:GntR family carbon starvation induced transcriptional regulator